MSKNLRKTLALLLSAVIMLPIITACGAGATPQDGAGGQAAPAAAAADAAPAADATEETPSRFQQSPMLDGRDLPPVDERLPVNPLVITPHETIGTYGGTWRKAVVVGLRGHALAGVKSYEGRNLIVWNKERTEIVPNLVVALPTISDDARTFTFTLREGLRWSDGAPMTTADVLFWFEARESHPSVNPGWAASPIRIDEVIVHDETTFSVVYNVPNPLAIYDFARHAGNPFFQPKHYLSQFHPDFNDDAEALAEAAGFGDWVLHFNDRMGFVENHELPTMAPFVLQTDGAGASTLIFERNPFFWAVDTAGNQLPYIDNVIIDIVESEDITMMRTAAGEIDMQMAVFTETFLYFPFLAENAAAGDFEVRSFDIIESGAINLHVNIAHLDPYRRAVFGDARFRHAMAYALDRDFIIATQLTVGPVSSTPRNFSPYPGSPWFNEAWSSANTTYDPDRANQLLDEMGLTERDATGMRLMPNGQPITLIIDVPLFDAAFIDLGIAVADYFRAVGIDASANSLEPALWSQRGLANEWDGAMMRGSGGFPWGSLHDINDYTGFRNASWMIYYQNEFIRSRLRGEPVDDVPPEVLRLWELGTMASQEINEARRNEIFEEIFQIHKDNLFVLGIGTILPGIYVVNNRMGNVPPLHADWDFGHGGHGRPSQYFFR